MLIPLSPALIFGAFGYQGLGPAGGAVAMLVYYALGTLAYAGYLWGRFGVLKPSYRMPRFLLEPALAVLRVGGMSSVVSASTNLTLAIVTAYVAMGGVEALAGYGAASRLEFLLVPLAYGIGGPVGIVISANLGAGRIERAIKASWVGVLMACALTELIGLAAAAFPQHRQQMAAPVCSIKQTFGRNMGFRLRQAPVAQWPVTVAQTVGFGLGRAKSLIFQSGLTDTLSATATSCTSFAGSINRKNRVLRAWDLSLPSNIRSVVSFRTEGSF
jgi:Na+-driven multidrug efflux pump